jgi:methionine-rich copper-binding protein CopC
MCCTGRRRLLPERRLQRLATSITTRKTTILAIARHPPTPEMSLKPSRLTLTVLTLTAASLCLATAAPAQTATAKPTAKAAKPAKAATKKEAPAVEAPLPTAEGEQVAAAALALYGEYACEFDQTVNVGTTPQHDGYVDVRFKSQTWTMKPVLSSTGALRLEDVKGRMLMLQIANKSMLMDTKVGQRIVDACMHEKQRMVNAAAAGQPAGATLLQGDAASTTMSAPK